MEGSGWEGQNSALRVVEPYWKEEEVLMLCRLQQNKIICDKNEVLWNIQGRRTGEFVQGRPFLRHLLKDMKFKTVMINMALICSDVLGNSRDRTNCTPAMHFV